jgi:NADH-quinone oxidoreductase subunit B
LLHALITLQKKIAEQELTGPNRPRHLRAEAPSEFPIPEFGEHDLVPAKNDQLWKPEPVVRAG